MFYKSIEESKKQWMQSQDCSIVPIIDYIKMTAKLRDTQIQAIETYLFLKIKGENKPLWQLFSEGFFIQTPDFSKLNINQNAREIFISNPAAYALFDFAKTQKIALLESEILNNPSTVDYLYIIKSIFYNVSYADYLMSLPMGAGKTFLMAAIIYLDLYFATIEPENPVFAHNFLVLIPSGLKSSIAPSLRTIQNFNASWVIAEPSATQLSRKLQFEVLDEQKASKKSNKARNPNAKKIQSCLPNPFGYVFVVNAEKVILESFKYNTQLQLVLDSEENDTSNDLKNQIGKIPNLSILIDEVHHAATDDVKLRQAVNYWQSKGNITTVLGFSGTPYLASAERIKVNNFEFKFTQITNTVYYYPLITAIQKFLKTPTVKTADNLDRKQIIQAGIIDFKEQYGNKVYNNGSIAKIAIYCSNIEVLEEEVYPFLISELKINANEILKFHGGNKTYSLPKENHAEFRILDTPLSKKRYILLVQVGKEGWDCPSLTSVILSQKGDSPQNMILQTACRCLRQVDKNQAETALIWLNKDNADTLNKQLKQEQNITIEELNNLKKISDITWVERTSRMDYLELPKVDFFQMKINYLTTNAEDDAQTEQKLTTVLENIKSYKTTSLVYTSFLNDMDKASISTFIDLNQQKADFNKWLFAIATKSVNTIHISNLKEQQHILHKIFDAITKKIDTLVFFDPNVDVFAIETKVRLAFFISRKLNSEAEIIKKDVQLLLAEKLSAVPENVHLYPNQKEVTDILKFDANNTNITIDIVQLQTAYDAMVKTFTEMNMERMIKPFDEFVAESQVSAAIKLKNNTLHYLPYDFGGAGSSSFEKNALDNILRLENFATKNLEIYYNGERGLTDFVINCFAKKGTYWNNIGQYTTDFLIIQRNEKSSIHKILMIETKGDAFANDDSFLKKKHFVNTHFLEQNKEKFGYNRFDFLYLQGKIDATNTQNIIEKIDHFFE